MTEQNDPVIARMSGFAGRTELYEDRVRMVRDGVAAAMAEILHTFRAEAETTIRMDLITGFEVFRPMILPPLLVLHYAGSRPLTGHYWRDAFAENVHMAGFLDQRDLEHFVEELETVLRLWTIRPAAFARAGR
ncbi:hypothetical protein BAL199_24079 [alpha proteobacterium BAL199]|jgi:hypothetical protein|nr:hypothetical protein BAL199_24079 [alpha proteobacterium BAL199]